MMYLCLLLEMPMLTVDEDIRRVGEDSRFCEADVSVKADVGNRRYKIQIGGGRAF